VRVCGLKSGTAAVYSSAAVTPRAGVWIEIDLTALIGDLNDRHTPCGCVD